MNMNEMVLFVEVVLMFSAILILKKFFGKTGLYVWIGLASVLANIQVIKSIELFGLSATVGNVMFASVFLATDLLSECYGKEAAKKGVYMGVTSIIIFIVCTQLTLWYRPCDFDISQEAMSTLFSLSPRVCAASLLMYILANVLDVVLYDKLRKVCNGRMLWLRNNVCTILCNCFENFGLFFLAFSGIYPVKELVTMAIASCVIEVVIALCDTPFLYIGKKI